MKSKSKKKTKKTLTERIEEFFKKESDKIEKEFTKAYMDGIIFGQGELEIKNGKVKHVKKYGR